MDQEIQRVEENKRKAHQKQRLVKWNNKMKWEVRRVHIAPLCINTLILSTYNSYFIPYNKFSASLLLFIGPTSHRTLLISSRCYNLYGILRHLALWTSHHLLWFFSTYFTSNLELVHSSAYTHKHIILCRVYVICVWKNLFLVISRANSGVFPLQ